jgi:hypothetical protein
MSRRNLQQQMLEARLQIAHTDLMFSIEHEFDATVVTLVDEGSSHLTEDITITAFAECVTLEQLDPRRDQVQKITLSTQQLQDLRAALDLPEGVYRLALKK